jgi:hypothetical protein
MKQYFKNLVLEIKLFLGVKKVSGHLLSLYRGERNVPYAFWFNSVMKKLDNKTTSIDKKLEPAAISNGVKRMKEIIVRLENRDAFKDSEQKQNTQEDNFKKIIKEAQQARREFSQTSTGSFYEIIKKMKGNEHTK